MAVDALFITDVNKNKLKTFDCGDTEYATMSFFLRDEALNFHKRGMAFTKVYIDGDNHDTIIGYSSLKASCFQYTAPYQYSGDEILHVVPSVEIARFAISTEYQSKLFQEEGEKYSDYILSQVLQDIMDLREYALGVEAVVLFSINRPKQLHFYKKNGFHALSEQAVFTSTENDGCIPMYMPLPPISLYL